MMSWRAAQSYSILTNVWGVASGNLWSRCVWRLCPSGASPTGKEERIPAGAGWPECRRIEYAYPAPLRGWRGLFQSVELKHAWSAWVPWLPAPFECIPSWLPPSYVETHGIVKVSTALSRDDWPI